MYNGKIKATKSDRESGIKGGGVYEVVDGLIIDSEGDKRPVGHRGFKTFDDLTSYYPEFGFVEEFTLDDLKAGMLVVRRNGDKLMVMPCEDYLVLIGSNQYAMCSLSSYDSHFKNSVSDKIDILRVYGYTTKENDTMKFDTESRPLLWYTKEVAMTLDEIKEKLGLSKDTELIIKNRLEGGDF